VGVAAVGLGLAVMAPIAVLPSWFPERPGLAYGIAFIRFGMGPLINVPLMEGLLSVMGGPLNTFYVLGIIYAAIIGGAAWFVSYYPALYATAGLMVAGVIFASSIGPPGTWRGQG
jgi:hypothetical protein